jgi:NAD(P)-dependent dehydrogenase (short-subunit alcohol dehydrogenase family)
MAEPPTRRWMITGVSSGFGRLLAEAVLARGDSVAGTLRQASQAASFEALAPGRAHAVILDVTERARIAPAVAEAVARLGGIDVLVNNAGYGLVGAIEELEEDQIDAVLETNLHGTLYVTRAALPALRESRGTIVNLSSMAGLVGLPGVGSYCAAKFGVEGLSEALRAELAPLGVRIMLVEPGSFRTAFAHGSIRIARTPMPLYEDTPAGKSRNNIRRYHGHERGDPAKAIAAILKALDAPEPPFRLVLGPDALAAVRAKIADLQANLAAWEATTLSTDYDPS